MPTSILSSEDLKIVHYEIDEIQIVKGSLAQPYPNLLKLLRSIFGWSEGKFKIVWKMKVSFALYIKT